MNSKAEVARAFVLSWLSKPGNIMCNVLDVAFVDEFVDATQANVDVMLWGANRCAYLSKTLAKMNADGLLSRDAVGLGANWQPGFPKWVYAYTLTSLGRDLAEDLNCPLN